MLYRIPVCIFLFEHNLMGNLESCSGVASKEFVEGSAGRTDGTEGAAHILGS